MDKLNEDTVSADRKSVVNFDPSAWKSGKSGRKSTSVVSRQNFNNAKYGNRSTGDINFVTGTAPNPEEEDNKKKMKTEELKSFAQYKGLEKEDKPGKVKTAIVKMHPNAVEGETVEGWKDEKKPVKEEAEQVEEAVRIKDPIRAKVGDVNYGKKDGSFQGKMERKQLAAAAKDRRNVTAGSGVSGFNSKMTAKPSTTETGRVRAVKEELSSIDEQIVEVLTKDASAGTWIHDFVNSDNPKFEGKSKEKRKEMALAAYYAKQRNEAVEPKKDEEPPFDPDPPKKNADALAGKYGQGYSTARHLARMGLKQQQNKQQSTNEGTEMDKLSFKQFVEQLDELVEFVPEELNLDEGMTATKVAPGVTRYTGGSYGNAKGAKYGNTNYEKETLDTKDDEEGESKPAAAPVKKGRGRPSGSYGTYKARSAETKAAAAAKSAASKAANKAKAK